MQNGSRLVIVILAIVLGVTYWDKSELEKQQAVAQTNLSYYQDMLSRERTANDQLVQRLFTVETQLQQTRTAPAQQ